MTRLPRIVAGLARLAATLLVIAGAGPVPGCRDADPTPIATERFVDAYMALVRARIDAEGDPRAYAAARDRELGRLRVTAEDLRGFVDAGREDPEALQGAWQAIAARMDTLYGGVTTEPPPELRGAIGESAPLPPADSL